MHHPVVGRVTKGLTPGRLFILSVWLYTDNGHPYTQQDYSTGKDTENRPQQYGKLAIMCFKISISMPGPSHKMFVEETVLALVICLVFSWL